MFPGNTRISHCLNDAEKNNMVDILLVYEGAEVAETDVL